MPEDSGRLRRAKPAYVVTVTMATIGFWWLVGVSQTPLGEHATSSRSTQSAPQIAPVAKAERPSAAPPEDFTARLDAAKADVDRAHREVESAGSDLAVAQQNWEQWLARREAQEKAAAQQPAAAPEASAQRYVANPQFAELNKTLQRLSAERDELLQRLTPEHPSVVDLNTRMAAVNQQLLSVPEMITVAVAAKGEAAANAPAVAPRAEQPADAASGDPEEIPSAAASTESDLRRRWDAAQETLEKRTLAEQRAIQRYESLRQAAARQPAPVAAAAVAKRSAGARKSAEALEMSQEHTIAVGWHLAIACGVLVLAELAAVRFALTLMAAERAIPLASVAQVSALLPVPVLATFPAASHSRPVPPHPGSVTALTVWLLVCEGTLAVMAFLLTALAIRNAGFPANLLRHPIESMAQGLRDLHS